MSLHTICLIEQLLRVALNMSWMQHWGQYGAMSQDSCKRIVGGLIVQIKEVHSGLQSWYPFQFSLSLSTQILKTDKNPGFNYSYSVDEESERSRTGHFDHLGLIQLSRVGQSRWISSGIGRVTVGRSRAQEKSFTSPGMIHLKSNYGLYLSWLFDMCINLNLFSIQEDNYNNYKDVFLLNHARQKVKFYPRSYLISHSLLMEYNTFNSWEPHGEREKRIINVTFAVVVLPSRHPPSWSFKPDTFIIITNALSNLHQTSDLFAELNRA